MAERIGLLDEVYQARREKFPAGQILVGGEEAQLLWESTVDCFAQGIWVAALLCAQATCERTLAGIISLGELPVAGIRGPKGWEGKGLGSYISHVRKAGRVPNEELDEVEWLCEARKPYGHWRLPLDSGTIGRAVAEALRAGMEDDPFVIRERILSQNALRGARAALLLYFGDHARGPYEP